MSNNNKINLKQDLKEGLAQAEYNTLREKAMRDQTLIQGDDSEQGWHEVSARELFQKLYGEPVPKFGQSQKSQKTQ